MSDDQSTQDPTQDQTQDDTQLSEPSPLPQVDSDNPAQPADQDAVLGDAHPVTDNQSNVDEQEAYDAGAETAATPETPAEEPGTSPEEPTA